jgi:hypothetical protein
MFFPALLPSVTLYTVILLSSLLAPTTALPLSKFSHKARSLHPTLHLLPRSWHLERLIDKHVTRLLRRGLPGAVYICTQENFRGDCAWTNPDNKCHIPGTGSNSPKSIGPDPAGHCILWEKATCSGNEIQTLRYPGLETTVPDFGGIRCYANSDAITANSTSAASESLRIADPRLPGGSGSLDAKELKSVLTNMEKDGFKEGMIGLKKGHYY